MTDLQALLLERFGPVDKTLERERLARPCPVEIARRRRVLNKIEEKTT